MSGREPEQLREFRAELLANPSLADAALARPDIFAPVPESERVLIRCDAASADLAICRALALAVQGIEARIELKGE